MTTQSNDTPPLNEEFRVTPRRLQRKANKKILAGVAQGLESRFDIDANFFRIGFAVLCLFWGLGAAIYLTMWALLPLSVDPPLEDEPLSPPTSPKKLYYFLGLALVIFLTIILLERLTSSPAPIAGIGLMWIILLIALSVIAVRQKSRRYFIRRFVAYVFLTLTSFLIVISSTVFVFISTTGVPMSGGNGTQQWTPTSLSQVRHFYRSTFGALDVNLSMINFPKSGYIVTASNAVGHLNIEIPNNVVLNLQTHVGIGAAHPYTINSTAPISFPPNHQDAKQLRADPHLTIDASVGIGNIWVVRESPASMTAFDASRHHQPTSPKLPN